MNIWLTIVLIIHVLVALGIIGLVLLQHGKGADVGAAFGSGASGSLFGASGSANFLSRFTAILAVVFFMTSLGLTYLATHGSRSSGGVMDSAPIPVVPAPTAPVSQGAVVPAPAAGSAPGAAGNAAGNATGSATANATKAAPASAPAANTDSKANEVPK